MVAADGALGHDDGDRLAGVAGWVDLAEDPPAGAGDGHEGHDREQADAGRGPAAAHGAGGAPARSSRSSNVTNGA